MVTGIDIVKEQIRIAAGERLSFGQDDVRFRGHAIEVRINAEDPDADFRPSPGLVTSWCPPGGNGVRVDSHVYPGYSIPPNYDSMIGKLIVHKPTRAEAIECMKRCLDEFIVEGIRTTIPLHKRIFRHGGFVAGHYDTGLVEDILARR
jgi:acetyl-CoA carboxylase biotin carboxylase subunit